MLTIERITDFNEFLKLESVWNELLAQSDADYPFLTFEWLSCWWRSYGIRSELVVLLVKENSEIVGIAPLQKSKIRFRGISVNAITFIANYHSNRSGFILIRKKEEVVSKIVNFLFNSNLKFDLLLLDFLVRNSDTYSGLMNKLGSERINYEEKKGSESPYITINEDWESYFKTRSQNFRHKLRKTNRVFEKLTNCRISKYTENNVREAMEKVLEISKKTWKYRSNSAIASNNENINFYSQLAKEASKKKWLELWELEIEGNPVAFTYNLAYKNTIFSLKIGYDLEYSKFSPSEYLNSKAIEECFVNKIREYDWLGEDLPFKMNWTSSCRSHSKLFIFRNSVLGGILFFVEKNIVYLIKMLYFLKDIKNADRSNR